MQIDQAALPEEIAWTLFGPLVSWELGKEGEVRQRSKRASQALDGVIQIGIAAQKILSAGSEGEWKRRPFCRLRRGLHALYRFRQRVERLVLVARCVLDRATHQSRLGGERDGLGDVAEVGQQGVHEAGLAGQDAEAALLGREGDLVDRDEDGQVCGRLGAAALLGIGGPCMARAVIVSYVEQTATIREARGISVPIRPAGQPAPSMRSW